MTSDTKFGVFLALTFEDTIYQGYTYVPKEVQERKFQNLLITLREDGYFGFIGGTADPGESEVQALARECMEEGCIDLSALVPYYALTRISEHLLDDGFRVILYHMAVSKEIAKNLIAGVADADHFFTETAGFVSVACHKKSKFNHNNFLPLVKLQLGELGRLIDDKTLQVWAAS